MLANGAAIIWLTACRLHRYIRRSQLLPNADRLEGQQTCHRAAMAGVTGMAALAQIFILPMKEAGPASCRNDRSRRHKSSWQMAGSSARHAVRHCAPIKMKNGRVGTVLAALDMAADSKDPAYVKI
jgi:hypothetical protein